MNFDDIYSDLEHLVNEYSGVKGYSNCVDALVKIAKYIDDKNVILKNSDIKKLCSNETFKRIISTVVSNLQLLSLDTNYLNDVFKSKNISFLISNFYNDNKILHANHKDNPNYYSLLSEQEFNYFFDKYKNGDKNALEVIIERNIRLVRKVAEKYLNLGLEYDDLVQEGLLGLITSLQKFEKDKNVKFSSYAYFWIKCYMLRAIRSKGKQVRIPADLLEKSRKFMRDYYSFNGSYPTKEVLAQNLNLKDDTAEALLRFYGDTLSIDQIIEDAYEREENVYGSYDMNFEDICMKHDLFDKVKEIYESNLLNEKEKDILKRRFGLFNSDAETLLELGHRYNVSYEAIRRRIISILNKIKNSDNLFNFSSCLDLEINNSSIEKQKYKTLYDYLNTTNKDLVNKIVDELDSSKKDVLKHLFGSDYKSILNKDARKEDIDLFFNSIISDIVFSMQNSKKEIKDDSVINKWINICKNMKEFKEAELLVGFNGALLLFLINGLVDGKEYSLSLACKTLNISLEEGIKIYYESNEKCDIIKDETVKILRK